MTIPFEETYHGLLRQHLGNQRIILPAVRAVIPDECGRILFVKRSDNGLWVMPAGSQELTVAAKFFPLDALPPNRPAFYDETLEDLRKFKGKVILK